MFSLRRESNLLPVKILPVLLTALFIAMFIAAGCSSSGSSGANVTYFGGDDPATADAITPNSATPTDGEIASASDADWFSFAATAGNTYTINVALNSLANASLTLYDTDGATEISSTSSSGVSVTTSNSASPLNLNWDCNANGTYYAVITGGGSGTYTIDVDENPTGGGGDVDGDGYTTAEGDCNDSDATINPGADEICGDDIDQDCDGSDLDCQAGNTYYKDADGDGFGDPNDSTIATSQPDGYVENEDDCDDNDADIHPGAVETCGDTIDQDCDGSDLACPPEGTYFRDVDGDGFGNPNDSTIAESQPAGYVTDNTDCDDNDATVHPGAAEVCSDNIDQNCSGQADEGCTTYYSDSDGDGYGHPTITTEATSQPVGYVTNGDDCDDSSSAVNPGATEICDDQIDNDCEGGVDEGCATYYHDGDGDGYGDPNDSVSAPDSTAPTDYITDNTDCDDTNAAINPGAAFDTPIDGIDQNCDGIDPLITFELMLNRGLGNTETAYSVKQTADGGYILAGNSSGSGWLVKTDMWGVIEWNKTTYSAINRDVQITYDALGGNPTGYVVTGDDGWDLTIETRDLTGGYLNDRWYNNSGDAEGWEVRQIFDSWDDSPDGFAAVGSADEWTDNWNFDVFLVRTFNDLIEDWIEVYGDGISGAGDDGNDQEGRAFDITSDGGFVLAGFDGWDAYVWKTNDWGSVDWYDWYSFSNRSYAYAIRQTTDGGYIVAGEDVGITDYGMYLLKLDQFGVRDWSKNITCASDNSIGYDVQQTSDGGYIIVGESGCSPTGNWGVYLVKTDSLGNVQWSKVFEGGREGWSVQQTADGGYVIAGRKYTGATEGNDFYLLKTDANGNIDADADGHLDNVDCNDNDASIHPGAADTSVDGIDQNCDGTDGS